MFVFMTLIIAVFIQAYEKQVTNFHHHDNDKEHSSLGYPDDYSYVTSWGLYDTLYWMIEWLPFQKPVRKLALKKDLRAKEEGRLFRPQKAQKKDRKIEELDI